MLDKSDTIYRKLILAHELISEENLLEYILKIERERKNGKPVSLFEFLLNNHYISPDDALMLRSEHDKVLEKIKEKTKRKRKVSSKVISARVSDVLSESQASLSVTDSSKKQEAPVPVDISKKEDIEFVARYSSKDNKTKANEKPANTAQQTLTQMDNIETANSQPIAPESAQAQKTEEDDERTPLVDVDDDDVDASKEQKPDIPDPLIGKMLGGCKLLEKIGEGGMGAVYKAHHIGLDKTVAVKILPPHLTSSRERILRFQQEAKSAAKMEHPNIVQILNIGEQDNLHFIVMQYIDGEDLRQRLKRAGIVEPLEAIEIGIQIAAGLATAHKKGIIHRDIKPDNIMFDKEGNVKITDFGLARQQETNLDISKTGKAVGTPYYMSPEQCSGKKLDGRSDIYSLGVTLYHITTGKRPFKGENPVATALMHIRESVTPPERINPNVPIPLSDVMLKMLEKNPDDRYQNCEEVMLALEQAREQIINARELESLADAAPQQIVTAPKVAKPFAEAESSELRISKRTLIIAGSVALSLLLLLVLVFALSGSSDGNNEKTVIKKTKTKIHPLPQGGKTQVDPREKEAKIAWLALKPSIELLRQPQTYLKAFQLIDDFTRKFKGTKSVREAANYKLKLQSEFKKLTEKYFRNLLKRVDNLVNKHKYKAALEKLEKINPSLLTAEISERQQNKRKEILSLAKDECRAFLDKATALLKQKPPLVFDALEVLQQAIKIGIDSVIREAKTLYNNLQKELADKQKEANLKMQKDVLKLLEQNKELKEFIDQLNEMRPDKPWDTGRVKAFVQSVLPKPEYEYLKPVYSQILDDLNAIESFWNIIEDKFRQRIRSNTFLTFALADGSKIKARVKKILAERAGVKLENEKGTEIIVNWQDFNQQELAGTAFEVLNRENPKAVLLYLYGQGLPKIAKEFFKKVPKKLRNKISWRFYKLQKWFSIYYCEIYGISAFVQILRGKLDSASQYAVQALKLNPHSGWGNIASAVIEQTNKLYNQMFLSLRKVPDEYKVLKYYQIQWILSLLYNRKLSEALFAADSFVNAFPESPESYLIRAYIHKEKGNKYQAQQDCKKGLSINPYNRKLYELYKTLR